MLAMRACMAGVLAMGVLGASASVRAEPPEPGTWRAGATSTVVQVERWDPPCGEAPRSSRSEAGGTVQLRRDGKTIVIDARGRAVRTGACWSRNAAIRRVSTQSGGGEWTTQCATPQGNPREERGRYTLKLLPDGKLRYEDASRFHWQLDAAVCAASTTTTQTLARVADAPGTPAAPGTPGTPGTQAATPTSADPAPETPTAPGEAPVAPAEPGSACTPGAAAKIVMRPKQSHVELGAKACFRAFVEDAAGCRLPKPAISWTVEHEEGISGRWEKPCFFAGDHAAEAEGTFRVLASVDTLRAVGVVHVKAADLSSLLAKRVEAAAIEGTAAAAEPAAKAPKPAAPPQAPRPAPAARVNTSAEATAPGAEQDLLLAVGSATAFVIVLVGWLAVLRSRKRRAEAEPHDPTEPPPAASLMPPGSLAPTSADQWICPTCRVGYPQGGRCPKDDAELVPWRRFAESRRPSALDAGKRCPKCGKKYDAAAGFCHDDGSALV